MSVLVVLTDISDADSVVHWGYQFARAKRESLVVLYASEGDSDSACVELPRAPAEGESASPVSDALRSAAIQAEAISTTIDAEHPKMPQLRAPMIVLKRLRAGEPAMAVESEAMAVQASLMVVAHNWKVTGDTLESQLFHRATVDTVVLRCGGHAEGAEFTARSVQVPAGFGGHVTPAIALGAAVATRNCGTMTAYYVDSPDAIQAEAVGERILRFNLQRAGVQPGPHVRALVHLDDNVERAIRTLAQQRNADLVLIGAEDERFIKRMLFSTFPESMFAGEDAVTLAIIRRAQPLQVRFLRAVERWFFLTVPQMTRDDRLSLYERLRTGSEWGFDFMALIALSTSIAALGLIQSSAAVVIGAMLVAPLMTPILGAGLAVVSGNAVLLRASARAIGLGFLLAVSIGLVVGLISPVKTLTPELISRGGPNLLDMGVAFISGVAAAFAMSRPNLLAALPGVAIAAALVPPIATVGIALAWLEFDVALGSAMLFGTNVVAIIIGASVVMFAVGVRRKKRTWGPWVLAGLIAAMLALAVPLAGFLWSSARQSARATVPDTLATRIQEVLAAPETPGFVDVQRAPDVRHPDSTLLTVFVNGPGATPELARRLADAARPYSRGDLRVRIVPVVEVKAR